MKVLKNFLYNFSYKILTMILPFVTVPYVTRVFNPTLMGEYNYTASIVAYFSTFGMLGIVIYGSNQIAKVSHKGKEEISHVFSSVYYFQLFSTTLTILVYLAYIFLFPSQYQQYFIVQIFSLIAIMFDISWLFQGLEDFKRIVMRNTVVKLIGVVSIFTLIKSQSDIYLYVFIISFSTLISQGIMWLSVKNYVNLVRVGVKEILSNFKPNLSFFLPQISISIYNTLDKIILGSLGSVFDVGIYTQAVNINSVLVSLVVTLSAVLQPRMTNLHAQGKKEEVRRVMSASMLFNSILTFPVVVGILLVSQEFVHMFLGKEYAETFIALNIVVFSLIPIAFSEIVGRQTLIPTDNVRYFTISVMSGAIVSILLNFIVIPFGGYKGAALVHVLVEIIVCALMSYYARKYLDILALLRIAIKPLVTSVVTVIIVHLIFSYIWPIYNSLLSLLLKIIVYSVIYGILLLLTRTITQKEISMIRKTP